MAPKTEALSPNNFAAGNARASFPNSRLVNIVFLLALLPFDSRSVRDLEPT